MPIRMIYPRTRHKGNRVKKSSHVTKYRHPRRKKIEGLTPPDLIEEMKRRAQEPIRKPFLRGSNGT